MAGEWRHSTWGEEVSLEYGKALRGYSRERGAFRVFGSNGPIGWTSESLAQGPGVILGRKGAYRGVEYSREPFWVIDTAYYVVPKSEFDLRWIYYAIKHHKLGEIDDGSPIPSTTRAAVYVKDVQIPPLIDQQAIACMLGALDNKIELNRRMNRTLEETARAIFKSWFVDFDPVRAKAAGQQHPDLKPEIAALFPDGFEDSDLGEIPKGWRIGTIGDLVQNEVDRIQPSAFTESHPYVPIECIEPRSVCLGSSQPGSNAKSSLIRFREGDILFGAMRPYFHKVCIAPFDGTTRTTAFVLRPAAFELAYIAFVISSDEFIDYATAHSEGSTIPYAKWVGSLQDMRIIIPPQHVRRAYHACVWPLIERMMASVLANSLLATLRDTLLPKLISGELRVPDAERIVGRAV